MSILNVDELTTLIDSRIEEQSTKKLIEILLKNEEVIKLLSSAVLRKMVSALGDKRRNFDTFEPNNPPSTAKSIEKKDQITGKEVQEILDPKTKKERQLMLSGKLIDLATRNNRNKRPYNIRRTINYILDHPQQSEFILPVMIDDLGITGESIRRHLQCLNFQYNERTKTWIKPEKWE